MPILEINIKMNTSLLSCTYKYLGLGRSLMILKKIIAGLFFVCFLNGCVQGTAFLGPIYTMGSTGSIYQTGLSYGSGKVIKKMTKKKPSENIKSFLDSKNITVKKDEFFVLVKDTIEKKINILNLANQ